jgi:5-methyltetrahydrofolate--homocysteine methyltransferase
MLLLIVGEKLNASIPATRQALDEKDADYLAELARKQTEAGSDYIDVNVGTGKDEVAAMRWLIGVVEGVTDKPLAIDTADPEVLEAGLQAVSSDRRPIVNSVTAESEKLETFLPHVKAHDALVVALAMGEGGIPDTVEERVEHCARIAQACDERGIPRDSILFDPLIVPQSTDQSQASLSLATARRIKEELPESHVCIGTSNVSFGLPMRRLVNATFAAMAIAHGVDAVILDPLDSKLMSVVIAADMLAGNDKHCKTYIRTHRNEGLSY